MLVTTYRRSRVRSRNCSVHWPRYIFVSNFNRKTVNWPIRKKIKRGYSRTCVTDKSKIHLPYDFYNIFLDLDVRDLCNERKPVNPDNRDSITFVFWTVVPLSCIWHEMTSFTFNFIGFNLVLPLNDKRFHSGKHSIYWKNVLLIMRGFLLTKRLKKYLFRSTNVFLRFTL